MFSCSIVIVCLQQRAVITQSINTKWIIWRVLWMGSLVAMAMAVVAVQTVPMHQPVNNTNSWADRCRAWKKRWCHGILVAEIVQKASAAMHPHHRIAAKRIKTHTFGSCKYCTTKYICNTQTVTQRKIKLTLACAAKPNAQNWMGT